MFIQGQSGGGQGQGQYFAPRAADARGEQSLRRQQGAAVAPYQAQKDTEAYRALSTLGATGLNVMGQYGSNRDTALANQSIAAANAYGSMANAYYNAMGQGMHVGGGLTAAGLNAGAQSAFANQNSNFDMSMGGSFGMGGGGGGRNGFRASGPDGSPIVSGRYGGRGGRGGMGAGFNNSGSGGSSMTLQKGSSESERRALVNQGYGFLGGMAQELNSPNNNAMALAGMMGKEFGNNRAAIMDPSIVNSLNSQVSAGYGALGGLYDKSDYGFNTGSQMQAPQFRPIAAQPDYWKNPSASGARSWAW